jgi:hypothetical protein
MMPLCSLLNLPTDGRAAIAFVFDHDQEHRSLFNAAGSSAGALPYFLDPAPISQTSIRAGNWQYNHQTSHDDFDAVIFGGRFGRQNIADSSLAEPASLAWWTFVNHHEHYIANQIP